MHGHSHLSVTYMLACAVIEGSEWNHFCVVFSLLLELHFPPFPHSGLKDTPTQEDWLVSVLPEGSKVGVDPFIIPDG